MKKIISILIMCSMLTSCIAIADNENEYANTGTINLTDMTVTGSGITAQDNIIKITDGGDFTVTGTLDDGMIYVNTEEKVKLRLSGMSLTNTEGPAIFFDNADKALITITENTENFLTDSADYGEIDAKGVIFSNDDLEIKGKGTLWINGSFKHGIACDDKLTFDNANLNITAVKDGIHVNDAITILGGTINISAGSDGIQSEGTVLIEDGTITVPQCEEGIESGSTLTVNGGNINIISTDDGLNSGGGSGDSTTEGRGFGGRIPENDGQSIAPPQDFVGEKDNSFSGKNDGGFSMRGGQRPDTAQAPDGEAFALPENEQGRRDQHQIGKAPGFSGNESGKIPQMQDDNASVLPEDKQDNEAADKSIYINGGVINVNAQGDGVDSNGNIYMTGGELYVNGPTGNGDGAIDCSSFIISGGTVAAAGSSGMAMNASSKSEQNSVIVYFSETMSAQSTVSIKASDGKELVSFTPEKEYSSLMFSSPELNQNQTYEVYIDDVLKETFEQTGVSESAGTLARGSFMRGGAFGEGKSMGKTGNKDKINVSLNNNNLSFDTNPIVVDGTTLVPLRTILEAFGMQVDWDDESSVITASKDGIELTLQIGSKTAQKNSESIQLNAAPILQNERTLVPVRFIAESLGMDVNWDESTKTVRITESA